MKRLCLFLTFVLLLCSCEQAEVPTEAIEAIDEAQVVQEQQEENGLFSQLRKVKYGMTPAEIRVLERSDPVTTSVFPGEGGRKAAYITTDYRDTLYGKYTCKITYGFRDVGEVFGGLFDNKYALNSVRYYIPNATYEDFRFFKKELIDEHGIPTFGQPRGDDGVVDGFLSIRDGVVYVYDNYDRTTDQWTITPVDDDVFPIAELEAKYGTTYEWHTTKTRNYYINFLFRFELQSDHGIERADPTPRGKWVIVISQHLYLLN